MSGEREHDVVNVEAGPQSELVTGPQSLVRLSSLNASRFGALVGDSEAMRSVFGRLERAAETDATMLLEGPAGTGKEDAASAVHRQSARSSGPLVVVDCAVGSGEALEHELFGDQNTGRPGAFELARGGSVFLDEVGALSLDLQARLLRVIENEVVTRIGGSEDIPVDARVIAASRTDLRKRVQEAGFRSELYFRLSVMRIVFPALEERPEDFLPITCLLLQQAGAGDAQVERFTSEAFIEHLRRASWPENVRSLRAYLERCLVMDREEPTSDVAPAPAVRHEPTSGIDASMSYADARKHAIAEFEKQYLRALLDRTRGNVSRAAREAGIDRVYMHRLMRRHQIKR